jgi:hypothetical protein
MFVLFLLLVLVLDSLLFDYENADDDDFLET